METIMFNLLWRNLASGVKIIYEKLLKLIM